MLNNHQALAASETPITSEISSNSETVANQNSTTIKNSLKETVNSASLESNQSNSTNKQMSSEVTNTAQSSEKLELVNKVVKHQVNHLSQIHMPPQTM